MPVLAGFGQVASNDICDRIIHYFLVYRGGHTSFADHYLVYVEFEALSLTRAFT
jgi:hypothetical protein